MLLQFEILIHKVFIAAFLAQNAPSKHSAACYLACLGGSK